MWLGVPIPRDCVLDLHAVPLEHRLDAPVFAVPDPSGESEDEGVPSTVGSEVDALDEPTKNDVGLRAHDAPIERRT